MGLHELTTAKRPVGYWPRAFRWIGKRKLDVAVELIVPVMNNAISADTDYSKRCS